MSNKVKVLSIILAVTMILSLAGGLSPVSADAVTPVNVVTAVNAYFANMPADIYKIGEKDFIDKVKAGEKMFILDIRSAADYEKGHVKGAVNAPWGTAISDNLKYLPADRPIMIYCYTGQTAGQAVATLNIAGFNAKSVNLGWNLGISKVAGYEQYVETKVNKFKSVKSVALKADVKAAIDTYYKGLEAVKPTIYANYKISEDEAKKLLDAKDPMAMFLSVRKAEDFAKGHIAGGVNIPFGKGMEQKFNTLPKDKKIIVYCYTGQTAGQTVAALRLLGYDAVSMHSGMGMPSTVPAGWLNKGYPVVSTVQETVNAYFANMPADIYKIAEKDFVGKVVAGENMLILDIRSAEDYGKGHVKGAVNAPWGPAIAASLDKLPSDKPIMIYCYTGQTAGQAVATLNIAGFNAKSVNLGWNLGISKVEGIAAVTETTVNVFPAVVASSVKPEIKAAITAYYDGLAAVKPTIYANYKISEDEAKKLLDAKDPMAMFLSVRKAEDFAKGHIAGAVNIPFGKGMEQKFNTLPKDKKIIVYCYTGQTAGQTVAALRLLGYDAVSMHSGMGMPSTVPAGWLNKGYPVVSTVQETVNAYFANMPADIYKIAEKDFVGKVVAGENMLILDIRSAEDYGKGHVKGAVNAPWGPAIAASLDKLPSDKPIMIYCYTGQTAGQAVATLNIAGFNAKSVNLGWNLGISKVEGIAAVTETTVNVFPAVVASSVKPEIKAAITAYYDGLAAVKPTTYANYKISEVEAKKLLDAKNPKVMFLSVRKAEDFAKGHIKGAVNIPFGKGMEQKFNTLPKDKKIIVYCYTGQTAGQTVAALRLLGYDAVSMHSGMGMPSTVPAGWLNKGYPVVK